MPAITANTPITPPPNDDTARASDNQPTNMGQRKKAASSINGYLMASRNNNKCPVIRL